MNYKIKIIVGFRRDQEHSISIEESHKAYYLFLHPEERGIFSDGLAIKGSEIQEIVPDYQGTMGWNPTHVLDSDDWNEIRGKSVDFHLRLLLMAAKEIAQKGILSDLSVPLSILIAEKYQELDKSKPQLRGNGPKAIGEILDEKNP